MKKKRKNGENDWPIEKVNRNFRRQREDRGWTVERLSKISGIHEKILTWMETGQDFDVESLIKLCNIYGLKPHEIFMDPSS